MFNYKRKDVQFQTHETGSVSEDDTRKLRKQTEAHKSIS
jgi:pterin-4a-carbinolamine dehydratase